jgi:hypothetical protein
MLSSESVLHQARGLLARNKTGLSGESALLTCIYQARDLLAKDKTHGLSGESALII